MIAANCNVDARQYRLTHREAFKRFHCMYPLDQMTLALRCALGMFTSLPFCGLFFLFGVICVRLGWCVSVGVRLEWCASVGVRLEWCASVGVCDLAYVWVRRCCAVRL